MAKTWVVSRGFSPGANQPTSVATTRGGNMCDHKTRVSENDKRFLRSIKVAPFVCAKCEGQPKLLPKKIRVEEERRDKRQEDEGNA